MKNDPSFTGISIAGFHFWITPYDVTLPEALYADSAYLRFRSDSPFPIPAGDRIDIRITRQEPPDLSRTRQLFTSQASWNVCGDGCNYFITFNVPPSLPPLWTAMIGPAADSVTVFCSAGMIDAETDQLIFNPVSYPLDQILLMHFLVPAKGGICHAAGWHTNGNGVVFPGVSGRGKSTISRLLMQTTGRLPISDDRVVIRFHEEKAFLYGTPWPGEAGYAENIRVPLTGIFFLSQGRENRIADIPLKSAVERLVPVLSIPWYDKRMVEQMLDFCDNLLGQVPAYDLVFRDDKEVVNVVERFMAD